MTLPELILDPYQLPGFGDGAAAAQAAARNALWLRIGNVEASYEEMFATLPPQRVLWKIEHLGQSASSSPYVGASPEQIQWLARVLQRAGHRTVVYTFTLQARRQLLLELSELCTLPVEVIPLAQKPLPDLVAPASSGALRLGAGGIAYPDKGLGEIAQWFERLRQHPAEATLSLAVIPRRAGDGVQEVMSDLGIHPEPVARGSIHIRIGDYQQWSQMCAFYRSLDVMVINSRADSWGRMLSEAIGWGVPVLVRRAECGTNYAWEGLTLFHQITDLSWAQLLHAVDRARRLSAHLEQQALTRYGLDPVVDQALRVLAAHTEPPQRTLIRQVSQDRGARNRLGSLLTY